MLHTAKIRGVWISSGSLWFSRHCHWWTAGFECYMFSTGADSCHWLWHPWLTAKLKVPLVWDELCFFCGDFQIRAKMFVHKLEWTRYQLAARPGWTPARQRSHLTLASNGALAGQHWAFRSESQGTGEFICWNSVGMLAHIKSSRPEGSQQFPLIWLLLGRTEGMVGRRKGGKIKLSTA